MESSRRTTPFLLSTNRLRSLDGQFGNSQVVFDPFVIGRSINFRRHRPAKIRDFLRPLVDQYDHEVTFRVIFHPFGYVMENRRLASTRGRRSKLGCPFAHWAEEVKHPGGHSSVLGFQIEFVLRLDGCQLIEAELVQLAPSDNSVYGMNVANLWVLTVFVQVGIGLDDGAFS